MLRIPPEATVVGPLLVKPTEFLSEAADARTDAILLGAEFGQNAILVGRSVQVAELVSCPVDLPE
jgi:hypothetical protein